MTAFLAILAKAADHVPHIMQQRCQNQSRWCAIRFGAGRGLECMLELADLLQIITAMAERAVKGRDFLFEIGRVRHGFTLPWPRPGWELQVAATRP